jgi:glutamine synthetase adenylyltransferase
MNAPPTVYSHTDITDTLVRLYVFLAQHMDRCLSEAARISYPESELQRHLASTRAELMEMLSVNQVVKGKVEQECNRVLSLVTTCLTDGAGKAVAMDELKAERTVLKIKTMALSDLLAVFHAA